MGIKVFSFHIQELSRRNRTRLLLVFSISEKFSILRTNVTEMTREDFSVIFPLTGNGYSLVPFLLFHKFLFCRRVLIRV